MPLFPAQGRTDDASKLNVDWSQIAAWLKRLGSCVMLSVENAEVPLRTAAAQVRSQTPLALIYPATCAEWLPLPEFDVHSTGRPAVT